MKILIVASGNFFSTYGGGQEYVKTLVDELVRLGIHPAIATAGSREELPKSYNGCAVHFFTASADEADLQSLFHKINPDVIHAHGWKAISAMVCNKLDIPCVITAHHGGIVCPAGALLNADDQICTVTANDRNCLKCCVKTIPGWRLWYPLLRVVPYKARVWAGEAISRLPFVYFLTPLAKVTLNIRNKLREIDSIGAKADLLIAPAPATAAALVRNGIPKQKVVAVPHGTPLPQRQPLRCGLGHRPLNFLYVGRINHCKGVHVMLEAFSSLDPVAYELHLVGGAVARAEQRYLAKLRKKYNRVNAVWHGSRPHEEVPDYLAHSDVMVHPAIFMEVFGLTIAEALAVGRPVIATRCGGAEAQIRDGENGLLVAPNDAEALREVLQSVINDPQRLQSMTEQTGGVVSIAQHITEIKHLYTKIFLHKERMLCQKTKTNTT